MENIIEIEEYLKNGTNDKIGRYRKSPVAGILVLIIGIAVLIVSLKIALPDALKMTLLTLGALGLIAGFLMLVFGAAGNSYQYLPTRSPLKHYRRYINTADRQQAINCLTTGDFTHLGDIRQEASTSAMVVAYVSRDGACAILQLMEYVPHHFQASTPVLVADPASIPALQQWLGA